jgi:hypothetical protein
MTPISPSPNKQLQTWLDDLEFSPLPGRFEEQRAELHNQFED